MNTPTLFRRVPLIIAVCAIAAAAITAAAGSNQTAFIAGSPSGPARIDARIAQHGFVLC
jgi:hypothetical protein